jgi:aspartate/glutamate racemase
MEIKIKEVERAISSGNYNPLQDFLLDQAILLNKTGMDFIELSTTTQHDQSSLIDIALKAFSQSQKTIAAIKRLKT